LRPARGVPTGGRMQQCTLSGITGVRGPQSQQALLVDDLLCEVLAARLGPQKYAYWNLRIRPAAPPKRGIRTIAARRASTRPGRTSEAQPRLSQLWLGHSPPRAPGLFALCYQFCTRSKFRAWQRKWQLRDAGGGNL